MQQIRIKYPSVDGISEASDAEEISGFFGNMSREERFSFLTELIVNQRGDFNTSMMMWPLWNSSGDSFREILKIPPVLHEWNKVTHAIEAQLETLSILTVSIEEIRHELSFKHGEAYEDQTLWSAQNIS